jgi:hypothetical protein|tara:strand:- start:46 stop:312 length:267 start_codon:yes stop_codon:yes gene_type:complete
MNRTEIKTCIEKELEEMLWTDGSADIYYYYHPMNRSSIACAIRKAYDLSGKAFFVVFWNDFGVVKSRDLDSLKRDVEQLVRIRRLQGV